MAPSNKYRKKVAVEKVEPDEDYIENEDDCDEEGEEPTTNVKGKQKKDELELDEVLWFGGTRADYVLLESIDDSNELVDGGKKGAIDDLEEGELEKFISKLGIRAYAGQQIIPDTPEDEDAPETSQKKSKKAKDKKPTEEEKPKGQPKDNDTQGAEGKKKTAKAKQVGSDGAPATSKQVGSDSAPATSKEVGSDSAPATSRKKAKKNINVFEFQQRQILLIRPGGKWHDMEYTTEGSSTTQDESLVNQYKALAQRLFEAETGIYKNKKNLEKGANSAWIKMVVSTGTIADRMAAMTCLIQDAPVHSLEHVENLVAMMRRRGGRRMGLMALDTLRELLISDLLPENRKLRLFAQHPFDLLEEKASGNRDARDRRLVLWYFEHQLKHQIASFVMALEEVAHDTVPATKAKALSTAHELLCSRPEQEKALLVQVVNKLGDPEYKTAAKCSYLLELLLRQHPSMKAVVCGEVERLMFRVNVSPKAQYYAVCFLNQVVLSREEAGLATKLITIYFSFFRACVKQKDIESKMLGALLSGVNRAYPYAKAGDEKVKEQLDTLFKVVHLVKFNTAVQALMLLFQVMDSEQTVSDRYYVALYRKLQDPGLTSCSKQSMFLNLVYKSLKADIVLRRVKAFVKRLLQVSSEQNPAFACGALFLVSVVMKAKPGLQLLLQEDVGGEEENFKDLAEEQDDDEEEHFVDADKMDAVKVEEVKVEEGQSAKTEQPKPTVSSWVHHQNLEGGKNVETYDPFHRNPLYCGANHTTLWELQRLSVHFHPSVSLFAKTILQGESIQYTGDPLQDFTLIRFLDRFVFRNPKQLKGKQTDAAVMQPKQKLSMNKIRSLAVNCQEYLSKEESQIPVDEVFFYRFFKKREMEKKLRHPEGDEDTASLEDVDDEEFEKILDSCEDNYFTDTPEDGLDFAGNVKTKKKGKKGAEDSESDMDESDVDGLDDEEVSLGSMDEEDFGDELEEEGGTFMNPDGDEGDEEVPELEGDAAFDDSEDELDEVPDITPRAKKGKRKSSEALDVSGSLGSKPGKKKKVKKDTAMFASAEEFGYMLDENADSKFDNIGMNAMANKDKAGVKQLKWEAQRDDFMNNRDVKTLYSLFVDHASESFSRIP